MTRPTGGLLFLILLLLTSGSSLMGQRKDFQSWFEAEFNKGLKHGIGLSAEVEQRFKGNSTLYDRSLVTLTGEYDIAGFLSTAAGMRFLVTSDRESRLQPRYRVHADATGSHSISGVDLSLRVRLQYGFEDFLYFSYFTTNSLVNRNRLKADYHIFGTKMDIFASLESWGLFGAADGRFFKKMRYSAGLAYSVNFRSELSLRYILEDEFNQVNPLQSHIIVVGYALDL